MPKNSSSTLAKLVLAQATRSNKIYSSIDTLLREESETPEELLQVVATLREGCTEGEAKVRKILSPKGKGKGKNPFPMGD